ncbi:DNA polymerase III subunit beta [Desulfofundulus thermobenzoicus]|uniref:Beta sliding clamp n=1 Tax=Desulfofundulus thermobenzoicus TaxID=29376 RepID=A0A6N7IT03_9FIRM|nr:DNA polymerase III subunit beta [Desulfofundulus thermobenzoicus]MQL53204.1 DNA polymerase III subunit beta [Desulfofundulus thermobenzoicus]
MKITTSRNTLAFAIQTANRAISPRLPLPILSGLLFEATGNHLTVTATDMDLTIQCRVEVSVEEEGAAVLPSRYIADLVRHLPDLPIEIQTPPGSHSAAIRYGTSQLNIHGFNPEQYPRPSSPAEGFSLPMNRNQLREMIRQVSFAVSSDETRPIFTGILMQLKDGFFRLVATDTHRLAVRQANIKTAGKPMNIVVPGKTLNELARLITGEDRQVEIIAGENHVFFQMEDIFLSSRIIAGQFPPYEQAIPQETSTSVRVETRSLLEATERAALLVSNNIPVVHFSLGQNTCVVSVHTEAGWIREVIDVSVDGQPLDICFNARYLIEILRAIPEEEALLEFTGPLSATIIRPVQNMDYLVLLLPARPFKSDGGTDEAMTDY